MPNHGVTVLVQDVGVLEQRLDVHETIVVNLQKEFDDASRGRFDESGHKLEHEHGLEGQVVVRVDKVLLQKVFVVSKNLVFLITC